MGNHGPGHNTYLPPGTGHNTSLPPLPGHRSQHLPPQGTGHNTSLPPGNRSQHRPPSPLGTGHNTSPQGTGHNTSLPPWAQVTTPPPSPRAQVTTPPPSPRAQVTTPPSPWAQVTTPPPSPRAQVTTPPSPPGHRSQHLPPPKTMRRRAVCILLECILVPIKLQESVRQKGPTKASCGYLIIDSILFTSCHPNRNKQLFNSILLFSWKCKKRYQISDQEPWLPMMLLPEVSPKYSETYEVFTSAKDQTGWNDGIP